MQTRTAASPQDHDLRDDTIEVGRYLASLRRSALLILSIVALLTVSSLIASFTLPKTYEAHVDLVLRGDAGGSGSDNPEALRRELATLQALVSTPAVLRPAAQALGVELGDLRSRVSAQAEAQSNILSLTARAGSAEDARDVANSVARSFLDQRERSERDRLAEAIASVTAELQRLATNGSDPDGQQQQALEQRRAELVVAAATAGTGLDLAQEAELPEAPVSPRPARNAVLAFFGSLVVCVLVTLGLSQLRQRG